MQGINDNIEVSGLPPRLLSGAFALSRAALFAPSVALAILSLVLAVLGPLRGLTNIAGLAPAFLVAAISVGLGAILRLATVRIRPMASSLEISTGFPRGSIVRLGWDEIEGFDLSRGIGGRLTGSGTLLVSVAGGQRVAVADLARPNDAVSRLRDIKVLQSDPARRSSPERPMPKEAARRAI